MLLSSIHKNCNEHAVVCCLRFFCESWRVKSVALIAGKSRHKLYHSLVVFYMFLLSPRYADPNLTMRLFRSSKTVVLLPPPRWKRTRVLRCHGGRWAFAAAKCGLHGEVVETLEGCWDVYYNAFLQKIIR